MGRAALIVAVLAVSGIWAGPAISAALITGANVKDRTLTGRDVKSNTLTGRVVAGLSGRDLLPDSVDGTDVLESSFSQVPSARRSDTADRATTAATAASAATAATVNKTQPTGIRYAVAANPNATTIYDAGGLRIEARCTGAGLLTVTATTPGIDAWMRVWGSTRNQGPQLFHQEDDDFRNGEEFNVLAGGDDNVAGNFVFTSADGHSVTGTFLAESGVGGRPYACLFSGTATLASP